MIKLERFIENLMFNGFAIMDSSPLPKATTTSTKTSIPFIKKVKHLLVNMILLGNLKGQLDIFYLMEAYMRVTGAMGRGTDLGFSTLIRWFVVGGGGMERGLEIIL